MVSPSAIDMDKMKGNPFYYAIKKEDLEGAFRDGLQLALGEVLASINTLVNLYANTAPASLWTWDFTSRWDFDMWY